MLDDSVPIRKWRPSKDSLPLESATHRATDTLFFLGVEEKAAWRPILCHLRFRVALIIRSSPISPQPSQRRGRSVFTAIKAECCRKDGLWTLKGNRAEIHQPSMDHRKEPFCLSVEKRAIAVLRSLFWWRFWEGCWVVQRSRRSSLAMDLAFWLSTFRRSSPQLNL